MNDYAEAAFDSYVVQLHQCNSMPQFDFVMGKASEDSDISHRDFVRLCKLSKIFMNDLGLPPDST